MNSEKPQAQKCYGCVHLRHRAGTIQTHHPDAGAYGCDKFGWVRSASQTPTPVTDDCKETAP